MEIEHIIAVAAILISIVFIFLCLQTSKPKDGAHTNQARNIPNRKQHFSLPSSKAGLQQESENLSVAKRLGLSGEDGCVVTISLDILHTDSYKNGSKILSTLANTANIFFLMKAATDEDEHNVCEILSKITVDFPIALHRVLFYQTSVGKLAVVRQLRPQLHVDFESCICRQIAPHVRNVLHIRGSEDSNMMDLSPLPSNSGVDKKFLVSIDRIEELLHLSISSSTGLK